MDDETKKQVIYDGLSDYKDAKIIELEEDTKYDLSKLRSLENDLKKNIGDYEYLTYEYYKGVHLAGLSESCKADDAAAICKIIKGYLFTEGHSFGPETKYNYLYFYTTFIDLNAQFPADVELFKIIEKWEKSPTEINLVLAELKKFEENKEKEEKEEQKTEEKTEEEKKEQKTEEKTEEKIETEQTEIEKLKSLINTVPETEDEEKQKEIIYNALSSYTKTKGTGIITLQEYKTYNLATLHSLENELKKKIGDTDYLTYEFYKAVYFAGLAESCASEDVKKKCKNIEKYLIEQGNSLSLERKSKYLQFYMTFINFNTQYPSDPKLFALIEKWENKKTEVDSIQEALEEYYLDKIGAPPPPPFTEKEPTKEKKEEKTEVPLPPPKKTEAETETQKKEEKKGTEQKKVKNYYNEMQEQLKKDHINCVIPDEFKHEKLDELYVISAEKRFRQSYKRNEDPCTEQKQKKEYVHDPRFDCNPFLKLECPIKGKTGEEKTNPNLAIYGKDSIATSLIKKNKKNFDAYIKEIQQTEVTEQNKCEDNIYITSKDLTKKKYDELTKNDYVEIEQFIRRFETEGICEATAEEATEWE